jgi:hypothetical protein
MLDVGVQAGATKVTRAKDPDAQIVPIPVPLHPSLPDGRYQVVDLTNPDGLLHEAGGSVGSVSCATIDMTIGVTGFSEVAVSVVDPDPATCYVPTAIDPPLTGPGGSDPMAGAESVVPCTLMAASGHYWTSAPHTGAYRGGANARHRRPGRHPEPAGGAGRAAGDPCSAGLRRPSARRSRPAPGPPHAAR